MPKQDMLINYVDGEECRIAIAEDGHLEELYAERASDNLHVGNIYRGKVTNVEPSIQAAFIDFGLDRNGFLHISDLHPKYFPGKDESQTERVGKKTPRRDRPPIQNALRRGTEIIVQVLKEGIGTKGPTLSSYLSIPGRFLVMMPGMERLGVSRKMEDEDIRREMRKLLGELDPPKDFGFIVRTAGIGRTKTELKRDLAYLLRVWKNIEKKLKQTKGPCELYAESDLVIRTLRDILSNDVSRIIVDHPEAAQRARDFQRIAMPRSTTKVYFYNQPMPLFNAFGIEKQIDTIHSRTVPMPSGGSLVIDQTEAMVAIDVNSGKYRDQKDAETTAFKTNIEACDEICRQLRLRDLGGLLVFDLIDMYMAKHRREVEKRFRDNLKNDRARTKVLRISELGLLEMTRQRMRPSLKKSLFDSCKHCNGTGHIKSSDASVLGLIRHLAVVLSNHRVKRIDLAISKEIADALLTDKKTHLVHLEEHYEKPINARIDLDLPADTSRIDAFDHRDAVLNLDAHPKSTKPVLTKNDEVTTNIQLDDLPEKEVEATPKKSTQKSTHKNQPAEKSSDQPAKETDKEADKETTDSNGENKNKRRRRRRRRPSRNKQASENNNEDQATPPRSDDSSSRHATDDRASDERTKDKSSDEQHRHTSEKLTQPNSEQASANQSNDQKNGQSSSKSRRRRRRPRRSGKPKTTEQQVNDSANNNAANGATDSAQSQKNNHDQPRKQNDQPQQNQSPKRQPQHHQHDRQKNRQHDRQSDHQQNSQRDNQRDKTEKPSTESSQNKDQHDRSHEPKSDQSVKPKEVTHQQSLPPSKPIETKKPSTSDDKKTPSKDESAQTDTSTTPTKKKVTKKKTTKKKVAKKVTKKKVTKKKTTKKTTKKKVTKKKPQADTEKNTDTAD